MTCSHGRVTTCAIRAAMRLALDVLALDVLALDVLALEVLAIMVDTCLLRSDFESTRLECPGTVSVLSFPLTHFGVCAMHLDPSNGQRLYQPFGG